MLIFENLIVNTNFKYGSQSRNTNDENHRNSSWRLPNTPSISMVMSPNDYIRAGKIIYLYITT